MDVVKEEVQSLISGEGIKAGTNGIETVHRQDQTPQQWRPLAVILPSENVFRRIHSRRHRCRGVCDKTVHRHAF